MRTFAILTTLALTLSALPMVLGDHGTDDGAGNGNDTPTGTVDADAVPAGDAPVVGEPSVEELMARIAELEAIVAALTEPGTVQEPCTTGVGCVKMPFVVDEIGDKMTGDLDMINHAKVKFLPETAAADGSFPSTVLGPLGFDIRAPANFTDLLKLHENATLNTTGGAKVFIDFDGNLTFADGSFLNPAQGFANQNWTFTNDVNILQNLTIHEGGTIIFENNTSLLQAGNFSRIGTTTPHPFYIIANNETAIVVYPGPTQGDAPSIVAGHPTNNVTAATIGNFIAGGGSAAAPNFINGSWGIILGGSGNTVLGDHGTAGGQDTSVLHANSFAWGDGNGTFQTTAPKTFIVNATGGVGINTDSPVSPLTVGGNITPDQDAVFSLGTPANRWHQLYMSSEIDFVTELLYTSGGATVMSLDAGGNLSFAGALTGDASGLTGVSSDSLADGSITTGKLADGAVTAAKMGEVCPVGSVLKSDGSGWACGVDVDTDTTYSAGSGLALDGTTFAVDSSQVQSRVTSGCAAGSSIRTINEDGSVVCELDDESNTDTLGALECTFLQVAKYDDLSETWVCGDDEDTTYGAGFGLDLQGTTFTVATSDIQRRVGSTCDVGSSIRSIAQDGTVVCETDDDTTYTAGAALRLVGTEFIVTCPSGESGPLVNQGEDEWFCGDIGSNHIESQGIGLDNLGMDCSLGEVVKRGNFTWVCAADDSPTSIAWNSVTDKPNDFADNQDDDTLADLSCSTNQIIRWNGASWVCATDTSPPRPGPGTLVGPFDADRGVPLVITSQAVVCYVDDNGSGGFNVGEPLYLHFGSRGCADTQTVSTGDLRLTSIASHAAFTVVRVFDADAGEPLSTYLVDSSGANLVFYDADGDAVFSPGDALYADGDSSGAVTPGDYRWTASAAGHDPGTVVTSGASDVNLVYTNLTNLVTKVAYWDIDANGAPGASEVLYLDLFQTGEVAPTQSVRLGDLGAV